MAHKIGINDRQEGLTMGWHGLTQVRESIAINDNWLAQWDVEKRPMRDPDGELSEWCRVVCTDDQSIMIGKPVHHQTYSLITNKQFLDIVHDALLSVKGAKIQSVGSVCDRGRVFVSVSVPDLPEFRAAGREFRAYLNFINSHDQSSPFVVNASNVCVVCDNTFRYNLQDGNNKVFRAVVRHTKNAHDRLDNIDSMIDAYMGTQVRFKYAMDKLDAKPIDKLDASRFFAGFLSPTVEIPSTQLVNKVDRLTTLFRTGRGNNGRSYADLFSAVTDYYTHESSQSRGVSKQVESSEFGHGAEMKTRAFDLLNQDYETDVTIARGRQVLAMAN
jgi:Domain of unknown function (DUF932)